MGEPEREALLDVKARVAALNFMPPQFVQVHLLALMDTNPAFRHYREAMRSQAFGIGLRYSAVRDTRFMATDPEAIAITVQTRARLTFAPRDDFPPSLVPDPNPGHLRPAKAPQLRKAIEPAFKALFAQKKESKPGGVPQYGGVLDRTPITVSVSFSNRGPQLPYHVRIPDETRTTFANRVMWDLLFAGASVELLCDLLREVVGLRNAILAVL